VADFRPGTPDQVEYLEQLLDAGLLIESGVPGIYGRGRDFEGVRLALDDYISRNGAADAEPLSFPPVLPREQLESTGYLKSFPHLAGTVFAFEGTEREALTLQDRASKHEDWSEFQRMSDVVLMPAACYPVYPAIAKRGPLPSGGVTIDPGDAWVFRHEPSGDPGRLMMFHMREFVRLGEADTVLAWRDEWRERGLELLRDLGLSAEFDVAADPFFGRGGKMLASNQREQALKFEILVQIAGPEPTAVASFNYHQEHFAGTFGIETSHGETAHTACLGFGHERITLALLKTHGLDPGRWPADVRTLLWP
jgi:seryl-tRNA synthetase